jgi:hypothetical protein
MLAMIVVFLRFDWFIIPCTSLVSLFFCVIGVRMCTSVMFNGTLVSIYDWMDAVNQWFSFRD